MNKATIIQKLIKIKILADAVNVPDDFTMSYDNGDFKYSFKALKENLDAMEFSINKLLNGANAWFLYYNEWYKVLYKVYAKQYSGAKQSETKK